MVQLSLDLPAGLSSFVAVAQAGSFAGAAVRLGTAMFQRSTRSVRLTDAGRRYFDAIEPAIFEASRRAADLAAFHRYHSSRLRMSAAMRALVDTLRMSAKDAVSPTGA